jgi:adenylosuccinate synthase
VHEYNYKGEKIAHFPYNIAENVTPVYQDFKGWKQDLTDNTDAN